MNNPSEKSYALRNLWRIAPLGLFFFGVLILEYLNRWIFLGENKINFGDLAYVIKCGQGENVENSFFSNNGCRIFMYGSINLRLIEIFNLKNSSILIIGILFLLLVSFIFASLNFYLWDKSKLLFLLGILIFFSPPIELILQRGNLDALIFVIVITSAFLFSAKRQAMSILLLVLSSLMKFYTLPLLVLVSLIYSIQNRKYVLAQIYLIFVVWVCVVDISRVPFFPWDARNMFGLPIYGEYLSFAIEGPNSHSSRLLATALGLAIFISTIFGVHKLSNRIEIYPVSIVGNHDRRHMILFFFNFAVFFSCFFAGLNIDYRLIFLAVAILTYLNLELRKFVIVSLAILLIITMFTSYNTYLLQPVGDFVIMILTGYFTVFIWRERKIFFESLQLRSKPHQF